MRIAFAGCGALGSWVAMMLAGSIEFTALLFDDDRIDEGNTISSLYAQHQIGVHKVMALGEMLFYKGVEATPYVGTITRIGQITGHRPDIIVDTFDNLDARELTRWENTLHAGVSVDRTGCVLWNESWTPVGDRIPRGENPVCTHHLGAQIIQFTAVACCAAIRAYPARMAYPIILENGQIIGGATIS